MTSPSRIFPPRSLPRKEDDARFTLDDRIMDVSDSYKLQHYHINVAAYLQLGKWFDYLKENGVYGNTLDVSSGKWYRIAGDNIFDKNNWIEVSK